MIGRSFGVGTDAGLTDRHIAELQNVQRYAYNEVGYYMETGDIYNEFSALSVRFYEALSIESFLDMY